MALAIDVIHGHRQLQPKKIKAVLRTFAINITAKGTLLTVI